MNTFIAGCSPQMITNVVCRGKRPDVTKLPADIDDGVGFIITQCWQQQPSLRPTFQGMCPLP